MKQNNKVRTYKVSPLRILCPTKIYQSKYNFKRKLIPSNKDANQLVKRRSESVIQNNSFNQFQEGKQQETNQIVAALEIAAQKLNEANFSEKVYESAKKDQKMLRTTFTVYKNSQTYYKRNPQRVSSSIKYNAANIKEIGGKSPYIRCKQDLQKVMRLLRPVKGPAESLLKQIKKYNNQNQKKAERAFLNKRQDFSNKMRQFRSWMGIQPGKKIFIMNSQDTHIREALLSAGWVQNPDQDSYFFHLKWMYIDSPQDYQHLQQQQLYNHFRCNQELTNKNNLRKNVKKVNKMIRPNVPPTFDLAITEQYSAFAESYYIFDIFLIITEIVKFFKEQDPKRFKITKKLYDNTVCSVLKAKNSKPKTKYFCSNLLFQDPSLAKDKTMENLYFITCFVCNFLSENKRIEYSFFAYQRSQDLQKIFRAISFLKELLKYKQSGQDFYHKIASGLTPFFKAEIIKLFLHLQCLFGNSLGSQNIWICKPVGVSRGSGISIQNNFSKLMNLKHGKIVQKYIQKPYLFQCKRKFDIRQWVLVKSFSPLSAYTFEHCYSRLSFEAYDDKQQSLTNLNKHLTNYSKNRLKFQNKEESVVSQQELKNNFGPLKWSKIKQSMKLQIYKTLHCCAQYIQERSSSFEIYGFDVMIDSNQTPWILQVNLSPACEKRAPFLGEYLQKMAAGVIQIIQGKQSQYWHNMRNQEFIVNLVILHCKNIEKIYKIQRWWKSCLIRAKKRAESKAD